MTRAAEVVGWINAQCARENLSPDGLGATIWAAVDTSEINAQEAPLLVRSLLSAGLDTTIIAIGNGLYGLAANPDQWRALRGNPSLIRSAFDEMLRWESPVQTFFRTTTVEVDLGGVTLPVDSKILLFLAAANRDPRRWDDPTRFDVTRKASGHVAFGAGIHMCVGQMLARLESEMVLAALIPRVAKIEIVAAPVRKLNNSLRQFASLPIELTPS
jgi:cytochrome P450